LKNPAKLKHYWSKISRCCTPRSPKKKRIITR